MSQQTVHKPTNQQPMELDDCSQTTTTIISNHTGNYSHNNNNNNNNNESAISSQEKGLLKIEKELTHLLDHSHELTTKLLEKLHLNKSNKKLTNKHRNNNIISEELENTILQNDISENNIITHFDSANNEQPTIITGGQMYPYQIEALNWMIQLYELNNNKCYINGILADDMGLGKTLETISLIAYLKQYRNICGPHIIIVPLTTSQNWVNEFNNFCPSINVFLFHGNQLERQELINNKIKRNDFDVLITSYEIAMIEKNILCKIAWQYLVIDEAHRIKNNKSKLSKIVRLFSTKYRLLLTGTPLQNNMQELWSLLNFLTPQLFKNENIFIDIFNDENLQNNPQIINKLHAILRPFMLRRLKSDVLKSLPPKTEICLYCGMSKLQKEWYKNILSRNLDEINRKSKAKTRLLNILIQLRKVTNHPYLFEGAENGPPYIEGPHLFENCGKLSLLDKLLYKLFANGSRVLIFSQMTRMLDILEDYMIFKQYKYCRIDGSTPQCDRNIYMSDFNAANSNKCVFLLSTRAGGLGINLQTADIVILYDSDWNPQMDIQAQDRAHRIGQTKPVFVYRLITENTIEEKILDRCMQKLYLNAIVVKSGKMLMNKNKNENNKQRLRDMITFGAEYILRTDESSITDKDINDIIQIGRKKTENMKTNIQKTFDNNIMDFKMDLNHENNYQMYDGKDYKMDYKNKNKKQQQVLIINYGPRQRNLNVNYKENAYFKQILNGKNKSQSPENINANKKIKKVFKISTHSKYKYDFQFINNLNRVHQLEEKQFNANEILRTQLIIQKEKFKKKCVERNEEIRKNKIIKSQKMVQLRREIAKNGGVLLDIEMDVENEEEIDEKLEWENIKNNIENDIEFLSKKEEKELKRLTKDRMIEWNLKDYNQFIKGCVEYGQDNIKDIADNIDNKSYESVKKYHLIFWKKYKKINNWKKIIERIENAENKRKEFKRFKKLNTNKIGYIRNKNKGGDSYDCVLKKLKLIYEIQGENKIKFTNGYTKLFDRFLLYKMEEYGMDSWDIIKKDMLKVKAFWNCWLLRGKTHMDIKNRALKLMHLLDICDRNKSKKKVKNIKKNISVNSRSNSVSSDLSELSNTSRKRVTKRFIEELRDKIKVRSVIEIYDEFSDKWTKCRVMKYCDKDVFELKDLSDDGRFEQAFKNLEFRIWNSDDDNDVDVDMNQKGKGKVNKKKKRKLMNGNLKTSPAHKRRKM